MIDPRADTPAPVLNALFQALADERRRDMLVRLAEGRLSASDLAEPLGMRLPSALKHLAILEESGLVLSQKAGRVRTYALQPAALAGVGRWIAARELAVNAAFDRLEMAIAQVPEEQE